MLLGRLLKPTVIVLSVACWFAASGVVLAEYSSTNLAAVCGYMKELGMPTKGWKQYVGDLYGCTSPYKVIGTGLLPNNIAYYVSGTAKTATELKLVLNVNNRDEAAKAHAELAKAAAVLVKKALNADLPKEARMAILQGKSGTWKVGKANLQVIREDWPTGMGYEVHVVIN